jgi:hypothetical protein
VFDCVLRAFVSLAHACVCVDDHHAARLALEVSAPMVHFGERNGPPRPTDKHAPPN